MRLDTYLINLSLRSSCRLCDDRPFISIAHTFGAEAGDMEDLESRFEEMIDYQKCSDGWIADYCPTCVANKGDLIKGQEEADADNG